MAPVMARLDADGDGRVAREEYAAVVFSSRPFEDWDLDGNGVLAGAEVDAIWLEQDPITFFPTPRAPPDLALDLPPVDLDYDVLRTLREEVLAKAPDAEVPSEAELHAVSALGGLDGAAGRAVLRRMRASAEAAGLAFPPSLGR
jgi:hypothetical protein